jgi:hypothetical protein
MDSCPKELKPYDKAHRMQLEEKDLLIHDWIGVYGISALSFAIEHCLIGNKARSKYTEDLILEKKTEEIHENMSEEKKRELTENLFMKLKIMGANHKRNHKDSTVS